jgi:thiaminase
MKMHLGYCKDFGISEEEVLSHEEDMACTAYTRYVLDIGMSEDWMALQIALLPCLMGYGMIATRLHEEEEGTKREGNPYWSWVLQYVDEDYREAVNVGRGKCLLFFQRIHIAKIC